MRLSDVRVERMTDGFRVSGRFEREDGPLGELYYEASGGAEPPSPEMGVAALLAAALPSTVWLGEDLRTDEPCDEAFARRATRIARGIALLHGLSPKTQVAAPFAHSAPREGRVVAASFSGGVDSFYTLFAHRNPEGPLPLGALVTVLGFDKSQDEAAGFGDLLDDVRATADGEGLRLFPIRTNFRTLFENSGDWGSLTHGGLLASLGFLLSGSVHTYLVPSSYPIDGLFAWGSHPMIDDAHVSSHTRIVHDAWHLNRNEKLPPMADWSPLLERVRVCARTRAGRNCGRCEKCIRTKLLFYLNDRLEAATALGTELTPEMVRGLVMKNRHKIAWYEELGAIARRRPEHAWVARAIRYAVARSRWRGFCRRSWNAVRGASDR